MIALPPRSWGGYTHLEMATLKTALEKLPGLSDAK